MKKIWLVGLIILTIGLWSNLTFAELNNYKPESEPDGFRDIKWGTDISTLPSMVYDGRFNVDYKGGNICKLDCYRRKEDKLQIGEAKVEGILYVYHKNKFGGVLIEIKGWENFNIIKAEMEKKFGKAWRPYESKETWWWPRGVAMEYNKALGRGSLTIFSQKFYEEIDKETRVDIPEEGF